MHFDGCTQHLDLRKTSCSIINICEAFSLQINDKCFNGSKNIKQVNTYCGEMRTKLIIEKFYLSRHPSGEITLNYGVF